MRKENINEAFDLIKKIEQILMKNKKEDSKQYAKTLILKATVYLKMDKP